MRLTPVLTAAFIALPTLAAAQEPTTIRIGWNQSPGHMASLAYLKQMQPDGEYKVLQNYGKTDAADPIRFQGSTHQITALATEEVDVAALSAVALVQAVKHLSFVT